MSDMGVKAAIRVIMDEIDAQAIAFPGMNVGAYNLRRDLDNLGKRHERRVEIESAALRKAAMRGEGNDDD